METALVKITETLGISKGAGVRSEVNIQRILALLIISSSRSVRHRWSDIPFSFQTPGSNYSE